MAQLSRKMTSHFEATSIVEGLGFVRREIPPDGNCLFRACAEICLGSQARSHDVRQAAHKFIVRHRARFEPFIDDCEFGAYVAKLEHDGFWGSDLELQAIAEIYHTSFTVFANQKAAVRVEPPGLAAKAAAPRQGALWFSHGNHYDALYSQEEFSRRGFRADKNAELSAFMEQRRVDEEKSLVLTRELSEEPPQEHGDAVVTGSDGDAPQPQQRQAAHDAPRPESHEGELAAQFARSVSTRERAPQHGASRTMLSDEQRRRPTIRSLLNAGFSEAELMQQMLPSEAYTNHPLPPELLRRPTVISLLQAGLTEDEIRKQILM